MESKEERASWPIITSLRVLHSLGYSEIFMELYREERREEGEEVASRIKGGNPKKRDRSSQ